MFYESLINEAEKPKIVQQLTENFGLAGWVGVFCEQITNIRITYTHSVLKTRQWYYFWTTTWRMKLTNLYTCKFNTIGRVNFFFFTNTTFLIVYDSFIWDRFIFLNVYQLITLSNDEEAEVSKLQPLFLIEVHFEVRGQWINGRDLKQKSKLSGLLFFGIGGWMGVAFDS